MQAIFDTGSKNQNRFTMEVEGHGRIYFQKGAYMTTNKDLITKLLQHPLKKRGEYKLVSNKDRVASYLRGEEPDKLTKEILENISMDGIVELGKITNATEDQPTLLRIELVGEPITDAVQHVLDFYERDKPKAQVEEEVKKDEEVSEIETTKSGDMTAKEAVDFIEKSPRDVLEDFLSEDEERVTVTRAYEEKMEN